MGASMQQSHSGQGTCALLELKIQDYCNDKRTSTLPSLPALHTCVS